MRALFRAAAVLGAAAFGILPAAAQDRLVIAGRDAGFAPAVARIVEAYQRQNPNVRIERLELAGGALYERIALNARERARALDVLLVDDIWMPEFTQNRWLADIDALGGVPGNFVRSADAVSRNPVGTGPHFAVPFVGNVAMFAYRSDLGFDRPRTWTDVLRTAEAMNGRVEGLSGVVFRGVRGNPIVTGFLPILGAYGGAVVDAQGRAALDSPQALAALQTFLRLKGFAPRGVETYNANEVRDAVQQGRAAIAIEMWPGWAGTLDDTNVSRVSGKVEVVTPPGEAQGPAPMLGAWLLAIPADSPNAARALDFLRFATSPEMQRTMALETGNPPVRPELFTDPQLVQRYRWYPQQLEALNIAQPRPRITQWNRVETILGEHLQMALVGQMEPQAALEEANRQIQRALAR